MEKSESTPMTVDQAKDTGMALVLLALILFGFFDQRIYLMLAVLILIANMVFPKIFLFPARLWFGLAHVMGTVMSTVILSIVFFLVVSPVGIFRRMRGADSMLIKAWKSSDKSIFQNRDHTFVAKDLEHPY